MMEKIKEILNNEKNAGVSFVVHTQNQTEVTALAKVLEDCNCTIQLPLYFASLADWMEDAAKQNNYDTCFRINGHREVAYNPSIEHWRLYCGDIIEMRNGNIAFHEGDYTEDGAMIEAEKILEEEELKLSLLQALSLDDNATKDDIVKALIKKAS